MITKDQVIDYLKNFFIINSKSPLLGDISKENGCPFSQSTVKRLFGTWNNALKEANLKANIIFHERFDTKCKSCGIDLTKQYSEKNDNNNYFCSRSCSVKYLNNQRDSPSIEQREKISATLKKYYEKNKVPDIKETTNCLICGKSIEYIVKKSKNKPNYCSNKCIGIKSSRTRPSDTTHRSLNEIYFSELCQDYFGKEHVTTNEKFFDNWDADVIIHNKKIAVLYNGVWHYKQITKKHSLEQVQSRDNIKNKIIEKYGYRPYTIKDMGKYSKKFVEQEFEIFRLSLIDLD